MGFLPQEPSIFRKLTVEENILAILETLDMSRADRDKRRQQPHLPRANGALTARPFAVQRFAMVLVKGTS